MKKRLCLVFAIFLFLFFLKSIFALGATPAVMNYNFESGLSGEIEYYVSEDNPKQEIKISIIGDLAEYFEVSRDSFKGSGKFKVKFELPNSIEKQGKNRVYVRVEELVDDELASGTIGTAVAIQGVIVINVPYEGKYAEMSFTAKDVNAGETAQFLLDVHNKGIEDFTFSSWIDISSQEGVIETLNFKDRELKSQTSVSLKKDLDTTNYNPGDYNATAFVNYGNKILSKEKQFRIGTLNVSVTNYTREMIIDGLKQFNIEVESSWNDVIDGVYADVVFLNGSTELVSFKTSSTSMTPWEKKNITGFFDTTNFTEGSYDGEITLFYYGKEIGKSETFPMKVSFVEEKYDYTMIMMIGGIVLGIIILIILIIWFFRKFKFSLKKK